MAFNLLANALAGAAYLILLFGLCFGGVVGIKLLNRKLRENERKPSDEAKEEEPAPVPEKKGSRIARARKKARGFGAAENAEDLLHRRKKEHPLQSGIRRAERDKIRKMIPRSAMPRRGGHIRVYQS